MYECVINGIPVKFPFEPYEIQKNYMSKVIECLQRNTHGVLESPTGTGKTLSLLCSSLAWLELKKAQIDAQWQQAISVGEVDPGLKLEDISTELNRYTKNENNRNAFMQVPQIIYSSRTHTQLTQAMQELKSTAYSYMKAVALGSREQMCVNPEVKNERSNANMTNLCRLKVRGRLCTFYNRGERIRDSDVLKQPIMDIEDLGKLGEKHKFCPYYMSRELKKKADIVFMPYNYILDPKLRKSMGVELDGAVIILDEAHNVDKTCEDCASKYIKSTDIALCIEEVTEVMKAISEQNEDMPLDETPPDISEGELCNLKEILLKFEEVFDNIKINDTELGSTFNGDYIFTIFGDSGVTFENERNIIGLIERIISFLTTISRGPYQRKGHGLQLFSEILETVFASPSDIFMAKLQRGYKVHITYENAKDRRNSSFLSKQKVRVLGFLCFNPGFGMNMLSSKGVKSIILTSGTLAPLKPLITELDLNVGVQLENPHIVQKSQIYVRILSTGCDGIALNSSYKNRNNPAYIKSLGTTIRNLLRIIPGGVLIFFPSYPVMNLCKESWQNEGLWNHMCNLKPIFIEPQNKQAFQEAINEYYQSINNPNLKGAVFMGVCRGKVSEGLDFVDIYGRAVIITGIPYPPMNDPKVILKKEYLNICQATNREYISGIDWYLLEATKAVNQAIGRVIRHKNDYGAIILLDERFNGAQTINNLSSWLRKEIVNVKRFGDLYGQLAGFYRNAAVMFPTGNLKCLTAEKENVPKSVPAMFDVDTYKKNSLFDFSTTSSCSSLNVTNLGEHSGLVNIYKRPTKLNEENSIKRKKISLIPNKSDPKTSVTRSDIRELLVTVKESLNDQAYIKLVHSLKIYKSEHDLNKFCNDLNDILSSREDLNFIIFGLAPYVDENHKESFKSFCDSKS